MAATKGMRRSCRGQFHGPMINTTPNGCLCTKQSSSFVAWKWTNIKNKLHSKTSVCKYNVSRHKFLRPRHTKLMCRLTVPVSQQKKLLFNTPKDYSRQQTSLNILYMWGRKYLSIPPGGGSLNSSFKKGNFSTPDCQYKKRGY